MASVITPYQVLRDCFYAMNPEPFRDAKGGAHEQGIGLPTLQKWLGLLNLIATNHVGFVQIRRTPLQSSECLWLGSVVTLKSFETKKPHDGY